MLCRDTVGVGGIEPVSGKEVVGLALGEQQPVKHQGAACGIPGGEFYIVGHHQNRRALPAQCQQQLRQLRLGIGVQPLGMLPQNARSLFVADTVEKELLDSAEQDKAKAVQMAEKLELTPLLTRHPYDLSGGEIRHSSSP